MTIPRDELGQYAGEWGDREYELILILENVVTDDDPDRTLAAYLADILEAIA